MIPNVPDSAFAEVFNSGEKYPCSPVMNFEFRGILINAPKEVVFGPGTRDPRFGSWAQFVICGACKFDWKFMDLKGDFGPAIQIVAVNTQTHQPYSGRMIRRGFTSHPPPEPGDETREVAIGRFFNPNLTLITHLPEEEGEYRIHATLGTYTSNTVIVRLKRQP